MDKAVLDIQGNLSFVQNAHWNLGYHFPFCLAFPTKAQAAPFAVCSVQRLTSSCGFVVFLLIQRTLCNILGRGGNNKNITF